MNKKLEEIGKKLRDANKKVQLIYAFNGSGKTRLSRIFKEIVSPKDNEKQNGEEAELPRNKILYYSAFTEDLFYWDNDLEADSQPKMRIQPNTFTGWLIKLLKDLGEDGNIASNFHRYTGSNANPVFNEEYQKKLKDYHGNDFKIIIPAFFEITFQIPDIVPEEVISSDFSLSDGKPNAKGYYKAIKISKGEESNFIWSIFFYPPTANN